jgi:hypothetical protein
VSTTDCKPYNRFLQFGETIHLLCYLDYSTTMSLFRASTMLRSAALRPVLSTAPRAWTQVRFATQDYGSGAGNPAGEDPQAQGKNSKTAQNMEHPGPEKPKAAQKGGEQSSSQSQSGGSSSSGGKASKSEGNKGTSGAKPKILSDNPPSGKEQSEEVQQHNKEMDQRAEKAHSQIENKDAYKDKDSSQS